MTVHVKDPAAVLDFRHDWTDWLTGGETIATSTWSVSPAGLTVDSDSATGTTATVYVSGGTAGKVYRLTNRITTNANPARTDERTVVVRVENT